MFLSESERQNPVSREGCPSPEDLCFSFDPECPPEQKSRIVDHVFNCPACRREFELFMGAHQLIARLEKKVPPAKSGTREKTTPFFGLTLPWRKLASTLVVLLVVISLIYLGINHWISLKKERKPAVADQIILHEEIIWPHPGVIRLSWKPVREEFFYRVEVYDQNMYLIWQSPLLSETHLELPGSVLDSMKDYQYFFWQLLIFSGENKMLESPVRKVRLTTQ